MAEQVETRAEVPEEAAPKRLRSLEKSRTATCEFADLVANTVLEFLRGLSLVEENLKEALCGTANQTCVAAILVLEGRQLRICSLGAGTRILGEMEANDDEYGHKVHDCHAEVLARRAFIRYLYSELRLCRAKETSIFTLKDEYPILRPELTFHFYSSSAPCGNSCVRRWAKGATEKRMELDPFAWPRQDHPKFHFHHQLQTTVLCKVDPTYTGHAPKYHDVSEVPPGTTLPSEPNASSCATCSDKMAKWQVMGLQGELFSSLLSSDSSGIRASTVVIGRKFSRPHVERAICCRLGTILPKQNHPSILCTSVKLQEGGKDSTTPALFTDTGLVWALERDMQREAEVINQSRGLTTSGEPSMVSRRELFRLHVAHTGEPFLEIRRNDFVRYKQYQMRSERKALGLKLIDNHLGPWPDRQAASSPILQ